MSFDAVFTPMWIGKMMTKNRLVVPPMATETAEFGGAVNDAIVDYYEARAAGGFGMIIVEFAAVQECGRAFPCQIAVHDDKFIPGLTKLATAIRRHGSRAVMQIHHAGRQTNSNYNGGHQPVAPSCVPCPANRQPPKELSTTEVYELIEDFVKAAVRAKTAGFDAVEVHAAHGYLLSQFLSPRANKRIDEFGGGFQGRTYIHKLILEGIREACGCDYPVWIRFNTVEGHAGGQRENHALVYAKMFEEFGYDALHVSAGSYGETHLLIPPYDYQPAWNMEVTRQIKENSSIPVIAVGRYSDPEMIEYVISNGYADYVSVGRQSIADPETPNKMFTGKLKEIVPCLSCSHRCTAYHQAKYEEIGDKGISCAVNPLSANRPELRITETDTPKKVMVIGAGPAGLEAAWISAARGHQVELYDKNSSYMCGGQFFIASYPPFKQTIASAIHHYRYMCEKHGVKMVFDQEVNADFIKKQKPDVVFIATGATPVTPDIKGMDKIAVKQANDVLLGTPVTGKVLVVGGGQVGLETAEYCTDYCSKITVVEMMPQPAPDMNASVLGNTLERFRTGGKVDIRTNTKVLEFTADGAVCECNGETITFSGYDSVILAIGSKPYNPFGEDKSLAKEVYIVGDAVKARSAVEALYEAAKIAVKI